MAVVKPNMFVVINKKDAEKLPENVRIWLDNVLESINHIRVQRGSNADPKYWVCNQDEPYAPNVIKAILDGEKMKEFLDRIGTRGNCNGCGIPIWWVRHNNQKMVPYTGVGKNHFIDCPQKDRFKK